MSVPSLDLTNLPHDTPTQSGSAERIFYQPRYNLSRSAKVLPINIRRVQGSASSPQLKKTERSLNLVSGKTYRSGVILIHEGTILCVKQATFDSQGAGNWGFPKGKMTVQDRALQEVGAQKPDEVATLTCATRELAEETGIELDRSTLVKNPNATGWINLTVCDHLDKMFIAVVPDKPIVVVDRREISKYEWMTPQVLMNKRRSTFTVNILKRLYLVQNLLPITIPAVAVCKSEYKDYTLHKRNKIFELQSTRLRLAGKLVILPELLHEDARCIVDV